MGSSRGSEGGFIEFDGAVENLEDGLEVFIEFLRGNEVEAREDESERVGDVFGGGQRRFE